MGKLYYCLDCRRIFSSEEECTYCQSKNLKKLVKMAPINVIGSKHKGNVFSVKEDAVTVLLFDPHNNRYKKDFHASELKKIL
ncbi:hypothetical protein [Alkaliphilus transvaalensis]|uniref:hypothetical protein n=1 Tax=Alkaliphilus transvaalensis TaxID=114628 RepID=UPI0004786D1F|nr:hypothetical protein [Alkaliphilus transvaalensis]